MRANPSDSNGPDFTQGFVRSGDLVTVTIGRNVNFGDLHPMNAEQWQDFGEQVREYVSRLILPGDNVFTFYGVGRWTDETTGVEVTEDSVTMTFLAGTTVAASFVGDALSSLARDHHQDAIAWAYGTGRLASASS